jgi:hypothetical protein
MKTFNPTLGIALLTVSVALCACGGGGSSTSNSGIDWPATPSWPVSPTPTPPSPSPSPSVGTSNTVPIVVDQSMAGVNQPAVTITLCPPGTANTSQCVTVKNMLVDTGSVGVRVTSSALTDALKSQLLTQFGASDDKIGNAPIVQCAMFASGYTWGPIKRADVTIGSKKASNLPIQVIGDGGYTVPSDCMSRGGPNLGSLLGSHGNYAFNGIVGIGHSVRDIATVAQTLIPATYYYCPSTNSCASTRVPLAKQVMNPVAAFSTNNNGTIIRLPALSAGGQASVTGELIFGVGTQQNNALPSNPTILAVDGNGFFTTQYQGRAIINSAIDSGTNGYAFSDTTIPTTGEWYTPSGALSLSATMEATNGSGSPVAVPFSIGNAANAMASGYAAYDNVGMYLTSLPVYDVSTDTMLSEEGFLWGLPFFYGRSVYTVLENAKVGTQAGPFIAF